MGISLLSGCGSNGATPAFEDAPYSDEVAAETPELASEMSMDAAGVDGGADSRTDSQTDQQIIGHTFGRGVSLVEHGFPHAVCERFIYVVVPGLVLQDYFLHRFE